MSVKTIQNIKFLILIESIILSLCKYNKVNILDLLN